ncbi:hypothetical protein DDB_G0277753 [Dictyostelium discoideum AX4]|uniref:Uncharacterized protein n=1 Tax=Dictyostelium discoideum TaxID=44689 RepID=Q86KS4_DICDI|nr:hypothetical protein DDB_G0277753 [Dictyostelium discoideum AX4]EAL68550.1 hypothetical protein DDB_G0277753 [Dictyostelium discoideum AX4]|eukprot:XP_642491.1 hypothetical protein DDB_G0277753 [Dictyostelium discoideum AX4]
MKLLYSLILLVLTCLISLTQTQYISIQNYQFSGNCNRFINGSSSDSTETCVQDDLLSGQVTSEGFCLIFNEDISTLTISPNGNSIIQSIYSPTDYNCQGGIIKEKEHEIGECFSHCVDENHGKVYSLSTQSSISFPSNTFVEVFYSGECNGDWKNNFNYLDYFVINKCNIAYAFESLTYTFNCNSTSSWMSEFNDENCTVKPAGIQVDPLANSCSNASNNKNHLDICNV